MGRVPDSVRLVYARSAPTPLNWYTQGDYEGCLITWDPPAERVLGYVIFRTTENLPDDCASDLLDGYLRDVADRIDIMRPIKAIVDDQIHERNRYLILARTRQSEYIGVERARSEKFVKGMNLDAFQPLAFWSNPSGDPLGKDPRRLDFVSIRPGDHTVFSWDYPEHIPQVLGYDLIVSRQAISPHTGSESDIREFLRMLRGELGASYAIEAFVNTLVDNVTPSDRYWSYALLACLPNGGRVQLPLRFSDRPIARGIPFRYLDPDATEWGHGKAMMEAAFHQWFQERTGQAHLSMPAVPVLSLPPAAEATPPPPTPAPPPPEPSPPPEAVPQLSWTPSGSGLDPSSYAADPSLVGLRLSWTGGGGENMVALRCVVPPVESIESLLQLGTALPLTVDRLFFTSTERCALIDMDCHDRCHYFVGCMQGQRCTPVEGLRIRSLNRMPASNEVIWHCPDDPLHHRLLHVSEMELCRRKSEPLALELGVHELASPRVIKLFLFASPVTWSRATPDDIEQFHAMQLGEPNALGWTFEIEPDLPGFRDDLSPAGSTVYFAAAVVDEEENHFPVPLFCVGTDEGSHWPELSSYASDSQRDEIQEHWLPLTSIPEASPPEDARSAPPPAAIAPIPSFDAEQPSDALAQEEEYAPGHELGNTGQAPDQQELGGTGQAPNGQEIELRFSVHNDPAGSFELSMDDGMDEGYPEPVTHFEHRDAHEQQRLSPDLDFDQGELRFVIGHEDGAPEQLRAIVHIADELDDAADPEQLEVFAESAENIRFPTGRQESTKHEWQPEPDHDELQARLNLPQSYSSQKLSVHLQAPESDDEEYRLSVGLSTNSTPERWDEPQQATVALELSQAANPIEPQSTATDLESSPLPTPEYADPRENPRRAFTTSAVNLNAVEDGTPCEPLNNITTGSLQRSLVESGVEALPAPRADQIEPAPSARELRPKELEIRHSERAEADSNPVDKSSKTIGKAPSPEQEGGGASQAPHRLEISWTAVSRQWYFARLGWLELEPRLVTVLWSEAAAPPRLLFSELEKLPPTVRRFEVWGPAIIDNITDDSAWLAALVRDAGQWQQVEVRLHTPPWVGSITNAVLLDRNAFHRVDRAVARRVGNARRLLRAGRRREAEAELDKARSIAPNNVRIEAFVQARLSSKT
ncbi:MAG: hypothetical protein RBU37_14850 [Myxococcota bacterium]|nr:hypothetical protein [Myxococcota bacterium]